MAYRRRRRTFRRRRYPRNGRGKIDWVKVARNAWTGVKYIKSIINVETNFIETTRSQTFGAAGTMIPISLVAQGDDTTNRHGRSILAKSVYLLAHAQLHVSADSTVIRYIILIDRNSNGVVPTSAELLSTNTINGMLNPDNAGSRFKVLCDKFSTLSTGRTVTNLVKCFRRLHHHIKFDGTTATQADAVSGHLYLYVLSDQPTNVPTIDLRTRVFFTDN